MKQLICDKCGEEGDESNMKTCGIFTMHKSCLTKTPTTATPDEALSVPTLTCVYCGQAYPPGTPTHAAPILTNHILICPKHPLSKVRKALVGLVGADTEAELVAMRGVLMGLVRDEDPDKKPMLDAIQALLETMPVDESENSAKVKP